MVLFSKHIYRLSCCILLVGLTWSCAHSKEDSKNGAKGSAGKEQDSSNGKSQNDAKQAQQQSQDASASDVVVTNSFATFTYSNSNNDLTNHRVKTDLAQGFAKELRSRIQKPDASDSLKLQGVVTAETIAGASLNDVLESAKRLMLFEMKQKVSAELSDQTKLQLAIAAFSDKKYTFSLFILNELMDSKDKNILAAVHNLQGLMHLLEKNYPDAALAWQQAVKLVPNYKPARLNLGFLAAKFGDFATAQQALEPIQNDWFALYGLAVAERTMGNTAKVEGLCARILDQVPEYKPALLTCALNQYQGKRNLAGAKSLLKQLTSSSQGSKSIDEIAYRVLERIDREELASKPSAGGIVNTPKANGGIKNTSQQKK